MKTRKYRIKIEVDIEAKIKPNLVDLSLLLNDSVKSNNIRFDKGFDLFRFVSVEDIDPENSSKTS